jgi:hypothetical protein
MAVVLLVSMDWRNAAQRPNCGAQADLISPLQRAAQVMAVQQQDQDKNWQNKYQRNLKAQAGLQKRENRDDFLHKIRFSRAPGRLSRDETSQCCHFEMHQYHGSE